MNSNPPVSFHYTGYEKCLPGHYYGPAIRAHYLVHFIMNGKGIYQTDGKIFKVEKNQAFLIRPSKVTFYQADKKNPWEYCWIAFDGPEADRIVSIYFSDKENSVCDCDRPDLFQQYTQTVATSLNQLNFSKTELTGWFYLFFSCFHEKGRNSNSRDKQYLDIILNFIRYNYMLDININELSDRIGIDRTYVYKIIKKFKNCSPKQLLQNQRICSAKDLLQYSETDITEISALCGFNNSSSFSKIFKQVVGKTPSNFRRDCLQKRYQEFKK